MKPTTIAIIGVGKIAVDQHLPVIAKTPPSASPGLVSQRGLAEPGVPTFRTPAELYAAFPTLTRWRSAPRRGAPCRRPRSAQRRQERAARKAADADGDELPDLAAMPRPVARDVRHLALPDNSGVDEAKKRLRGPATPRSPYLERGRAALASRPGMDLARGRLRRVRSRHQRPVDPDQDRAGAVFVTRAEARLSRQSRHADRRVADLDLPRGGPGAPLTAEFDWRQTGDQTWTIDIAVEDGPPLRLTTAARSFSSTAR